jgi:hypothetical protein
VLVEVHVARRGERGDLAIVERRTPAVGHADDHVPAAADVSGLGKDDRHREAHGDRGVDCIAAALEDLDAGFARQ